MFVALLELVSLAAIVVGVGVMFGLGPALVAFGAAGLLVARASVGQVAE